MEPAAFTAVADILARGLTSDEGDYRSAMVEAEAMLRALCVHTRSRDVLSVSKLLARSEGAFHVCVAAGSNSGKSTLVCALARAMVDAGRIECVKVLTADTLTAEEQFAGLGCKTQVGLFAEETVEKWVARLERQRLENVEVEASGGVAVQERTLLVLDDVVGAGVETSKAVTTLFTRGRHLGVYVCLSRQQPNRTLTPTSKNNTRFIVFTQLTGTGMKRLWEDMVLRPPMKPAAFEAWVSERCVDYAFGLYDSHLKTLSVVRA
jgi:hypothetical protein